MFYDAYYFKVSSMLLGLAGLLLARTAKTVFVTGMVSFFNWLPTLLRSILSIYLDSCFHGAMFDFIIFCDFIIWWQTMGIKYLTTVWRMFSLITDYWIVQPQLMYATLIGLIPGLPKQEKEKLLSHKGIVHYFDEKFPISYWFFLFLLGSGLTAMLVYIMYFAIFPLQYIISWDEHKNFIFLNVNIICTSQSLYGVIQVFLDFQRNWRCRKCFFTAGCWCYL